MDIIRHQDQYYILATSSRVDDRTRVLKHGETFAVFDRFGDMAPVGIGELGLYHEGTRFLSRLGLFLDQERLLLLSSRVSDDNTTLTVDLTNPDVPGEGDIVAVSRGAIHVAREMLLREGICYERIRVSNYALQPIRFVLRCRWDADYADIFEVRGTRREAAGRKLDPVVQDSSATLAYKGLDGVIRRTRVSCDPAPSELSECELALRISLRAHETTTYHLTVACEQGRGARAPVPYDRALADAREEISRERARATTVTTSNEQFNIWIDRSAADLRMMLTETSCGPYPYAGVPWFSAPFGRDGIITALQMLWMDPGLARGVLRFLADTQAQEQNVERDAEPGKIVHEIRRGEMAALGEVPFRRYYGSVDSTPLFVMLAGAYARRTGDLELIRTMWPCIELALRWMEVYGDLDHDGFVEYFRNSPNGLVNQGWKDSGDSIVHEDGTLAQGPIALCEVQGYVYAARREAAALAFLLGREDESRRLTALADSIRERFERSFWCEDLDSYALALDGQKRPCRVVASNAGHALWSGIAEPGRAERLVRRLMREDVDSGWGIRTLAAGQPRYNPMSYHDGSVWPHDNAIVAAGLARYGFKGEATRILSGLFDASAFLDLSRLPE
ncbi:MAG TPA: amylo-alpha-1,6-glucosidase, partial [Candidatus Polarisedimenticolia bacterium]|nr:amylo-alpha-1,6-glucosidase [Candidatus Polarisedimenticolia bacterium]